MFGYYLELAVRSLRRDVGLTLLMVLAIGVGIGASMTALTVYHVLDRDPYPGRSGKLYRPQLDPRRAHQDASEAEGSEPLPTLGWTDGMALLQARRADRQALVGAGSFRIEPAQVGQRGAARHPFAIFATADFFSMFGAPFRYGRGWSASEEGREARVVVLGSDLNDQLFAGRDSTGQTLLLNSVPFQVIGVLAPWRAWPRVYGPFAPVEYAVDFDAYLPLTTAIATQMHRSGTYFCWEKGASAGYGPSLKTVPCAWLAMWVELDSPAKAAAYRDFLAHYSREQQAAGRFERAPNVRLRSLQEWLTFHRAVPADVRLQTWLAFGFLWICMINATGLLLAKFMSRRGELGVRRALGATRRDLLAQLLVEAGMIGMAGGSVGLALAYGGLWAVRLQPGHTVDYASLAHLDAAMLALNFVLALLASLAIGWLPAWQACRVAPALQLKTA